MVLRRWLVAAFVVAVSGCQSAAQTPQNQAATTPTVALPSATAAPTAALASAASPAAATQRPTAVPAARPTSVPSSGPPPASASRVETLSAANTAFSAGDVAAAAGLYERVVNTPPATGESAAATAAINDFADFRAVVALLAAGREDDARTRLDALQRRDPNVALARLGNQLWDQYGMTGQLRPACAQLQPQIAAQAGAVLASLEGLGVTVDAASLCNPPGA